MKCICFSWFFSLSVFSLPTMPFSSLPLACLLNDDVLQGSVLDPSISPYNTFPLCSLIHSSDLSDHACILITTMDISPVLISEELLT